MSDSSVKFDWLDVVKTGGTAVATTMIGVLVRLLFGRAMKGIDDSLKLLSDSNAALTLELKSLRGELADCRTGILLLQQEIDHLKALPVPVGPPR